MKIICTIILFCCLSPLYGQEWRDSLKVARAAYEKKNYQKALKYYQSAQKNAPDDIDLSDEMGQSAYKSGDFEKAEKIYQQNNQNKKSSKSKSRNYHNLGNSRMKQKNYQGAVEAYKESLRNNPDDEQTRYNLSEAKRQIKKEQQKKQQQNQNSSNKKNDQSQNKEGQSDKKGDQQNKGDKSDQKGQNGEGSKEDENKQGNPKQGGGSKGKPSGKLSNKNVDKILDDLMKREAETKRRMYGSKGGYNSKSGKDW